MPKQSKWKKIGLPSDVIDEKGDWKTRDELQAIWGCCKSTATVRIARAISAGEIEKSMKRVKDAAGAWMPRPCYRVKGAK